MILTKEKSAILGTKNGTGGGRSMLKNAGMWHMFAYITKKKVAEYLGKMGIETFCSCPARNSSME